MVIASAAGLLIDGLYTDGAWAREALRGGDLTTLAIAVPVLIGSLVFARRGSSSAAQAVWLGVLAYSVYNYAYFVFGAEFNDIFVLHIALFSLSIITLVLAVASVDIDAIAARFRGARGTMWIGGFLAVVGAILGGLWVFLAIRFAITGELMADIPVDGIHLVFAIDTSLLVPALVMAGVLLWRRTTGGFVFGPTMLVMGAYLSGESAGRRPVPGERGRRRREGVPTGRDPLGRWIRCGDRGDVPPARAIAMTEIAWRGRELASYENSERSGFR